MKEIPLTKGKVALVDDDDFEELSKWSWHYHPQRRDPTKGYAARGRYLPDGRWRKFFMHSQIMQCVGKVDHKNGDGLDNRRENLRRASNSQNGANAERSRRNTTGFKGVSFFKRQNKFAARVRLHGKSIFVGYFNTAAEAGQAYLVAARSHHGEFARV